MLEVDAKVDTDCSADCAVASFSVCLTKVAELKASGRFAKMQKLCGALFTFACETAPA